MSEDFTELELDIIKQNIIEILKHHIELNTGKNADKVLNLMRDRGKRGFYDGDTITLRFEIEFELENFFKKRWLYG